eukprot:COSAG01_NODE_3773_length_5710_cov_473.235965_1_plen_497_part_00
MVHQNSISCGQALGTDDHTTLFRFDTPPNGEESPTASNLTGMWFDMHELLKFYRRQGQMYIDCTATSERASAAEAVREALASIITHVQSGPYARAFSALKTAVVTAWMSLDDQDFAFGIAYADPDSSTWTERLLPRQQLVWESHKWESYKPETMTPDTDDKMGGNIRLYSTTISALGLLCPSFKSQFGRLRVFPDNYSTDYVHSDTMLQELQDDTRDGNYQAALTDKVESRLLDGSPGPLLQVVRCRTGTPEICDNLWGHKHHMPATEDSMPFVGVVLTCDDRIGLLATSAGSPVDHWHVSMDVVKSGISPCATATIIEGAATFTAITGLHVRSMIPDQLLFSTADQDGKVHVFSLKYSSSTDRLHFQENAAPLVTYDSEQRTAIKWLTKDQLGDYIQQEYHDVTLSNSEKMNVLAACYEQFDQILAHTVGAVVGQLVPMSAEAESVLWGDNTHLQKRVAHIASQGVTSPELSAIGSKLSFSMRIARTSGTVSRRY